MARKENARGQTCDMCSNSASSIRSLTQRGARSPAPAGSTSSPSQACKMMGYGRGSFYRSKELYDNRTATSGSGVAPVSWTVMDLGERGVAGSFRS